MLHRRGTALLTLLAALFAAAAPSAHAAPVSGEYIVQFAPAEVSSAGARRAVVEHVGGTVTRDVRLINAVGAELTRRAGGCAARGRRGQGRLAATAR